MPRVRASDSDPIDFCREHFPDELDAEDEFGDVGDGPDGRGNCFSYEDDHPPYEGEDYECHVCGKVLTAEDN